MAVISCHVGFYVLSCVFNGEARDEDEMVVKLSLVLCSTSSCILTLKILVWLIMCCLHSFWSHSFPANHHYYSQSHCCHLLLHSCDCCAPQMSNNSEDNQSHFYYCCHEDQYLIHYYHYHVCHYHIHQHHYHTLLLYDTYSD